MATTRIIDRQAQSPDDERQNWALRPTTIEDYIGQVELVERVRIAVQAARQRSEPVDHVLLHGPPGLGKTTLAHVIAGEMGSQVFIASGPALTRAADLVGALTRLQKGDVLFIDEIHRLPPAVEEFIYSAMEDFRVDVTVERGVNARTVSITVKPFTLIGATTRAGLLSGPLRSRFGLAWHFRHYTEDELMGILARSAGLLSVETHEDALTAIARRSRGAPRIANRLLRRARDYAQVRAQGRVTPQVIEEALALEGVDDLGLDQLDRAYLRTIATVYAGGPVGLEAIAATMNEDLGALEDVVEPYLLQRGLLSRTRRGRRITPAGAVAVGLEASAAPATEDEDLFPGA